jgi:BirA family biotin operon repressor/biotin-[acetyl-CoA-carboxylase] ligase
MGASPYADLSRPPLSQAALHRALVVPGALWTEVRVVAETGSTNADVMAAAQGGAPEGLVVIAERQVAGRGRLDRRWLAPAQAALTLSVLLRPTAGRVSWLPLLAGVALADAVGRLAEVEVALKWPNDLLVRLPAGGWGKCGGILAEAGADAVVLGLGLNVAQLADELPPPLDETAFPPTSLALAGAALSDRPPLVKALLRALEVRYRGYQDAGGDPVGSGLADAYREYCATIDQEVTVSLPNGTRWRGRACDVDVAGRLVVVDGDGTHVLSAGDVHHVR